MKVTKAPATLSGPAQAEMQEFADEQEVIRLGVEIEMRQGNIVKMGDILVKAKYTVNEAQSRVDYEHLRLHKASERLRELKADDR